jgi:hypothetical protein
VNLAHVHLLLNHFPTVGLILSGGLFLFAAIEQHHDGIRASLALIVLVAVTSVATFFSGGAAADIVATQAAISPQTVQRHEDAALIGFLLLQVTGFVAWVGLWQWRQVPRPTRWNVSAVFLLVVLTIVLMARAATIGGEIHHPEIVANTPTAPFFTIPWMTSAAIATAATYRWAWPTLETLHFIGLALLFGVLLLVNCRVLGVARQLSYASVHRLLPWAVAGFGANVVTGTLFFVATPQQYTHNTAFQLKIGLMLAACAGVLYLTIADAPWRLRAGDDAPMHAKVVAAGSMLLWIAVIYCGRMLPFIGNPV